MKGGERIYRIDKMLSFFEKSVSSSIKKGGRLIHSKSFNFTAFLFMTIFLITSFLGGSPLSEQKIPATAAGNRLSQLLEVMNSGKRSEFRSFIQENFNQEFLNFAPLEEHLNVFGQVYDQSRGYDFHSILKSSDYELSAILRNKLTEGWLELMLRVEAAPPYKISGLGFRPSGPPSDLPPSKKLRQAELISELERFLDKLVAADIFSGSVLVAKDGKPLFKKAYGFASKSYNVPNRVDTKFNLGSMNKVFTAVAIAQLVERGKLSYDDLIGKYLGPDWIKPEVGQKVKICHLLSHTSGLGSYFNEKFDKSSRLLFRKVDDYKTLVGNEKLAFEPGTKWQYSNTGFLLLGAIIEKVTGQSYFDYVLEHIFKPAGMTNTDSYEMDKTVPNLAIGYDKQFNDEGGYSFRNNLFDHVIKGGPAGGGFSTVEDLLNFDIALRSDKLIKKESRELLTSPKPELKSPNYGYGFGCATNEKLGRIVGHSGGFVGINSNLDMYLDSGYTVVVLSNYSGGSQAVNQKIRELLLRLGKQSETNPPPSHFAKGE